MSTHTSSRSREYAQFFGVLSGLMAYGIHFTLFVMTAYLLIRKRNIMYRAWFYLAYICLQFTLSSIGLWRDSISEGLSYIDHADDPIDYYNHGFSTPPEAVSVAVFAACTWLQDGLLLYRCLLFYSSRRSVLVLPVLLFIGSVVTSILFIIQEARNRSLYTSSSIDFGIAYWSLSIAFNLVVTLLIVGRLYFLRRQVQQSVSPDAANIYTSIGAMLVESAALYSITGLIFIGCYARDNAAQYLFITWLGQFESISPLLIILRVAQGQAWSSDTSLIVMSNTAKPLRHSQSAEAGVPNGRMICLHPVQNSIECAVSKTVDRDIQVDGLRGDVENWHRLCIKDQSV